LWVKNAFIPANPHPGNEDDSFLGRIRDAELRERMLVRLAPGSDGMAAGIFDVVLADVERSS
jgi:hypothetical protein